jgi:hypothetical protein
VLPALCLCELLTSPPDALSPALIPRVATRLLEHIHQPETGPHLLEFFFKRLAHRQKKHRETAKRALSVLLLTLWAWTHSDVRPLPTPPTPRALTHLFRFLAFSLSLFFQFFLFSTWSGHVRWPAQEKHALTAETLRAREAQWTSYAWIEVSNYAPHRILASLTSSHTNTHTHT